jgi:hypothetical protein
LIVSALDDGRQATFVICSAKNDSFEPLPGFAKISEMRRSAFDVRDYFESDWRFRFREELWKFSRLHPLYDARQKAKAAVRER